MPPITGTLLIPRDVGAAWCTEQIEELARRLGERLSQPVIVGFPDDPECSIPHGIEALINAGVNDLVVVPFGVLPIPREGRIHQSLVWAREKWPAVAVRIAAPLTWLEWSDWIRRSALDALKEWMLDPEMTAVLLVGQGSPDSLANANLARLSHLIQEDDSLPCVKYAFLYGVRPGIPGQIDAIARERYQHVVVIPWLLGEGELLQQLRMELKRVTQGYHLNAAVLTPPVAHGSLVNFLASNQYAAVSDDEGMFSKSETSDPTDGLTDSERVELQELEQRINALLPPEYKGRFQEVRPRSMGTAKLKYDSQGNVAWDEIWTSFCDLALAGGPPHRGMLLEGVTSEQALAEPEKYQQVVAEIERGIRMVTGLPTLPSKVPGWVGIRCHNEDMAVWLMRAIVVENVMVRREGDILYLPAGPHFRVEKEIKNVITSLAKTVHYWTAHLKQRP
ncbi:MAG: CbiX/SirB N-terminal domain-containing protein [Planctomycetales bacterium]